VSVLVESVNMCISHGDDW